MSNCFILLAAGKGKRFKSNNPKQFVNYINKPLFMHSVDKALKSKLFKSIIIVSNAPIKNINDKSIKVIKGGKERYQSSQKALNFLKNKKIKNVFIHDAARPNFSIKLLKKLNANLKNNKAVVPFLKTDSSIKYKDGNILQNLDRDKLMDFLLKLKKINRTNAVETIQETLRNIEKVHGDILERIISLSLDDVTTLLDED